MVKKGNAIFIDEMKLIIEIKKCPNKDLPAHMRMIHSPMWQINAFATA